MSLCLPLEAAEALESALNPGGLEDLLEGNREEATLGKVYRILTWRILAVKGGTGLTGWMADLARQADSVEEYEAARDRALGPILDGLDNAENRDP